MKRKYLQEILGFNVLSKLSQNINKKTWQTAAYHSWSDPNQNFISCDIW